MAEFSLVPWDTGDYITLTKKLQESANDIYNRERSDRPIFFHGNCLVQGYELDAVTIEIQVDNVTKASRSGAGSIADLNIDVASVTPGVKDIKILIDDGSNTTEFVYRFYMPQDINLVSIWADFSSERVYGLEYSDDDYYLVKANSITVMGHREAITA